MDTVCRKCGVLGYFELLIYCIHCDCAAEHRYCLNEFPENDEEVIWSCEECSRKAPKMASINKLSLDRCQRRECEDGNLRCNGVTSAASPYPPKKRRKHRSRISCTEAKAKVSLVRHPSRVYAEDSCGSVGPSLQNDQDKCLSSFREKSKKDQRIERHRRRLILADADGSDEESESGKLALSSADKENTNQRVIQTEKSLCLSSLNDVPDYSAVQLVCSGAPDQSPNTLQAIFAGASEQARLPVLDASHSPSNISLHGPYGDDDYVHAQPIINPVWRGCFDVNSQNYGMVAHVSNKACSKVYNGVKMFSPVLSVEMLPRAGAWPKSFQTSPPTDDNIGLYFFPESERHDMVFSELLHEINDGDLSLKVIFDEAELLIFSSILLPQQHSRFNGKYYLWGAFRSHPLSQRPGDGKRTVGNSTIERCVPSSAGDELFRSTCDKEPEKRLLEWMGENPGSSNDSDNDELALFPLNVEDIAVKARVGGRLGLDLELGLSRPVDEDHEASLGCKPRSGGTTDASLAFDNAVIALNSRSVA